MTELLELPSAWRASLLPASFNGARFHTETNARESGRRTVEHQFPKKELPYAEDMGRQAREFTVRGYCIVYPYDRDDLNQRDYRIARDALLLQLEQEGPGVLQLPTQPSQMVVCPRFRMTEEDRFGGYCVFDMTFQEYGVDPSTAAPTQSTASVVATASQALSNQVLRSLTQPALPPPTGINA